MAAPWKIASSSSSLSLEWTEPSDNGGCTITGYAVFRNDGNNGPITIEANEDQDTNIRDRPTLRKITVNHDTN
jgi:hypothetical protein